MSFYATFLKKCETAIAGGRGKRKPSAASASASATATATATAFDHWLSEMASRSAILKCRRLEVLAAGEAGKWYSRVAEARYPGDPQRALQFCEEKLEKLARRGRHLFIAGTATLREEPDMKEWM